MRAIPFWRWVQRSLVALLTLFLLVILLIVVTPQGRNGVRTVLFVFQVLDFPVKPQSWVTAEPVREEISFPLPAGSGAADVYRSPGASVDSPRAGVLLFLGANASGRDDPDVVNLGNSLARAGFAVMFYWSPTMGLRHNMDPNEIENLVWAFRHLSSLDYVDPDRVGMGGFCVGASFALVAASDPRISGQVSYVNAFGPYYDARDLLLQIGSRSRFQDDGNLTWQPDQLTLRVFANELIETLENEADRQAMSGVFLTGSASSESELNGLSEPAVRVRRLLEGTTLEDAQEIYRRLPEGFRQSMDRISPRNHLDGLKAKPIVMHTVTDQLIPVGESRRLNRAFAGREGLRYTEFQGFDHVRPTGGSLWRTAAEGLKLYRHMYTIIREAS